MRAASDRPGNGGPRSAEAPSTDFAEQPAYRCALRLFGFVFDLEPKFPDDERVTLYLELKRTSTQVGSLLAAGFGREPGPAALELWERARSNLMEARHYVLAAHSRYMLDAADAEAFEAVYAELLGGIETLLGQGGGAR
jgi:23S rRNA-intervening sequence protein